MIKILNRTIPSTNSRLQLCYTHLCSSLSLCFTLLLSLPTIAQNIEEQAFGTLNLNPLVQIFGLPQLNNRVIGKKGAVGLTVEQQVANYHSQSVTQSEAINLDGESWRTSITTTYGIDPHSQLSLSIPFIRHSGGYMDSAIYHWHDALGLPQGARTQDTHDDIDIRYFRNNQSVVSQRSATSGIGDIRIKYGYRLPIKERSVVVQSEIKLPTGSIDRLTGSEGTDISVGLMVNDAVTLSKLHTTLWYGGASSYLEKSNSELSAEQNNLVFSGKMGLGWRAFDSITLKTQLDAHSAIYESDTQELGEPALMLTLGGDIYFSTDYRLELSVVEDLVTDASPDVIFNIKFTAGL